MTPPPDWLWDLANRAGVTALLVYFIVGISRGWWIAGREFVALETRCRKLEDAAASQEKALQEAVHALHQVVGALRTRA
jgi:uncharacterized membrane protein YciS (DUF1049 family)